MTPARRFYFLFLIALASFGWIAGPATAFAAPPAKAAWSGVVTYVVDGDTVRVRPPGGGKPVSVRIDGIDAPEICQAFGPDSRDALMRRVLGKRVKVHGKRHDDYGRLLARIELNGDDTGQWMVARGMAWSYRFRSSPGPYAAQQRRAKAAGLGMFSPANGVPPVYPAQFRKQHGSCYSPAR
ncbi:MAG: thermonuclease family protein [Polaromonas sp.]|nr:thermonuclease family protein [Polaromonas sp.]